MLELNKESDSGGIQPSYGPRSESSDEDDETDAKADISCVNDIPEDGTPIKYLSMNILGNLDKKHAYAKNRSQNNLSKLKMKH